MNAPVILIEAQPRGAVDGVAQTVRLAGGGADLPYFYAGEHWKSGIVRLPTFITSLDFDGTDFGTGGIPTATEIAWGCTDESEIASLSSLVWFDAPITVRIGPEGALPPVVVAGKVLNALPVNDQLKLQLSDPAAALKKPLLTERFDGTGGLQGPSEWEGRIRRRAWGRVWNQRGEPIDKANNIYNFADPLRPLQSIDAVRDKGAPAAVLNTLAWAGTAADTFAALQAAAAPAGGGVLCPSIACVKWWTEPAGDLNADIKGEIATGYVETTASIAQRLVEAMGGPAFAAGTVAAANAARPAVVGWTASDDNTTVASMLDELLRGSSMLWLLNSAGEIVLREWAWGAPAAVAISHDVSRREAYRPLATRKLGYRRNESPMDRGAIAAVVFATDVAYLDGTAAEDLKPAEAGATVGAPVGTPVGTIAAEDVSETVKSGGGVANDMVSTPAINDLAVTRTASMFFDFTGWSNGVNGVWYNLDSGSGPLQASVTPANPADAGGQVVGINAMVVLQRDGGSDDDVGARVVRTNDGAILPETYSALRARTGKSTYGLVFSDPSPIEGTANIYRLQLINNSDNSHVYETALRATVFKK